MTNSQITVWMCARVYETFNFSRDCRALNLFLSFFFFVEKLARRRAVSLGSLEGTGNWTRLQTPTETLWMARPCDLIFRRFPRFIE